jgi:hypothetical protein
MRDKPIMSDPNDKSDKANGKPDPEVLGPEHREPSPERARKAAPVIEGEAEVEAESKAAAGEEAVNKESGGGVGLYGIVVVAGLVGAIVVGGGLYGAGLLGGSTDRDALAGLDARVASVETNDAARADALKTVEQKLQAASESSDSAVALSGRLDALEAANTDMQQALSAAQVAAAASATKVDELQNAMPPADIADQIERLSAMVKALNTAVDSLAPKIRDMDARVAVLEAKKDDPDAAARAALGLALSNLSRAASRSEPFARELDVVATFLPNEPELAELKTVAAEGVPTEADIQARFPALVQSVLDAERAAKNEGLWQRFLSNARKLITVRRTGEISGEDTDAVLARMEERVNRNDLSAALQEAKGLQGAAAEAAAPWVKDATARVTTSDLLSALTADVTKRLAAGAKD